MPVECPRCLETNPDTQLHCTCGYDLSLIVRRRLAHTRPVATTLSQTRSERSMSRWDFSVWVGLIWVLLSFGEGFRLKLDLASRATSRLVSDSLLIGFADLLGALVMGALGWIGVWVLRSSEAVRYRPCPKRTTLSVTIIAAGLVFIARLTPPGLISQYVLQGMMILLLVGLAYFAGSRRWLGKW